LSNTGGEDAENVIATVTLPDGVTYDQAVNASLGWEPVPGQPNTYRLPIDQLRGNDQNSYPIITRVDNDISDGTPLVAALTVVADNVDPFNLQAGAGANLGVTVSGDACADPDTAPEGTCTPTSEEETGEPTEEQMEEQIEEPVEKIYLPFIGR